MASLDIVHAADLGRVVNDGYGNDDGYDDDNRNNERSSKIVEKSQTKRYIRFKETSRRSSGAARSRSCSARTTPSRASRWRGTL